MNLIKLNKEKKIIPKIYRQYKNLYCRKKSTRNVNVILENVMALTTYFFIYLFEEKCF